ncbi:hypothetical protein PHBOTO_006617 [Pseudozyma hubeiensis]|nr:hypothetical protein PHBOTO_006617 [Pseudozyma hubeiensis]
MIPLHVFVLILMGRFSPASTFPTEFTAPWALASMQVPLVVSSSACTSEQWLRLASLVFFSSSLVELVRSHVPSKQFKLLLVGFVVLVATLAFGALVALTYAGYVAPWTGRSSTRCGTRATPRSTSRIIASVSEHQPPAWPAFFFDSGEMLIFLFPVGVFLPFQGVEDEHVFVIIYAVMASYFAGVMVRLMLTLTPVVAASGTYRWRLLQTYLDPKEPTPVVEGRADAG